MDELNLRNAEEPEQPPRWLSARAKEMIVSIEMLAVSVGVIVALCLIPSQPASSIQTIVVPARVLPPVQFTALSSIKPTGKRGMVNPQDISRAIDRVWMKLQTQASQASKRSGPQTGGLCAQTTQQKALVLIVSWTCRFVTFTPPPGVMVLSVRIVGDEAWLQIRAIPARF